MYKIRQQKHCRARRVNPGLIYLFTEIEIERERDLFGEKGLDPESENLRMCLCQVDNNYYIQWKKLKPDIIHK